MGIRSPCPFCGTPISGEGPSEELCPACLLELALSPVESDEDFGTEDSSSDVARETTSALPLAPGRLLGRRYRIRASLGRGGLGEVWRGFDLKLRVDVALKSVRKDLRSETRALELLRREVLSARRVSSPNVCRVFDLIEVEGHELVSMEYIDGATLAELLRERGPLPLDEAQEIASQLLAGLTAIHEVGLVHRDLKPENVMLTRAGRVIVMDLGLARGAEVAPENARAGTPHYMAPEQARGEELDLRADLFSVGVLLAEMVAPGGVASEAARGAVWSGLAHDPPRVAGTPWAAVIRRAVSADRDRRFENALALSRALEEATRRAVTSGDRKPYPGLSSFTAKDAGFFFGREVEVEALWRKLRRPGLLGVIGPSGAGKSSFLQAGLIPARPADWGAVVLAPGDRPVDALIEALRAGLEREGPGTDGNLRSSLEADLAARLFASWRQLHTQALIVVDPFEELFTRCPKAIQGAFVSLVHRLSLDGDVHILLAMRDDFLIQCQRFEELRPIFADLTPLGVPTGAALRRALVQPALKCGYRFEDEALVETMIAEVQGERGALPLLAFACAQLWERRDRERGVLTRASYEAIGGVAGALAQHAEATLEEIGRDRSPLVRELFRNLVTAQGTRAARDRSELLSVFAEEDRTAVAGILDALVASRLIVSYEAPRKVRDDPADAGGRAGPEPAQRLEIVHESLLKKWPRLVQWRAQDEEGAVLRDQLREAAQLWQRHDRSRDFLWSGTAYREFQLWRERYPGGLTALEEQFSAAMTKSASRRTLHRRLAMVAAVGGLVAALAVVTALRLEAVAETRKAEASSLLALAQLEIESNPTVALTLATRSLELADSDASRLFAMRALATGPPASLLAKSAPMALAGNPRDDPPSSSAADAGQKRDLAFSPDGRWIAITGVETVLIASGNGGWWSRSLEPFRLGVGLVSAVFDRESKYLYAAKDGALKVWSVPDFELVEERELDGGDHRLWQRGGRVLATSQLREDPFEVVVSVLEAGSSPSVIDRIDSSEALDVDARGERIALAREGELFVQTLGIPRSTSTLIGPYQGRPRIRFHPEGDRVAVQDLESGGFRILAFGPVAPSGDRLLLTTLQTVDDLAFDASGERFAATGRSPNGPRVELWDLRVPGAGPVASFPTPFKWAARSLAFTPEGQWLVTSNAGAVCFWPLGRVASHVVSRHSDRVVDVAFTLDGSRVVSVDQDGEVRQWPLSPGGVSRPVVRAVESTIVESDETGRLLVAIRSGDAQLLPLQRGSDASALGAFGSLSVLEALTVDAEHRKLAIAGFREVETDAEVRVWDLGSGRVRTLESSPGGTRGTTGQISGLGFLADGSVVSTGERGLRVWSETSGGPEIVAPSHPRSPLVVLEGGRSVVHIVGARTVVGPVAQTVAITDVVSSETRVLRSHGDRTVSIAGAPSGRIVVSGSLDGIVRAGGVSGDEPHLLLGHAGRVNSVAVSPDGRWIASGGDDQTVRLWPMPDFSQTPPHELPRAQLVAKLRGLTNVRVGEDESSARDILLLTSPGQGYVLDLVGFRGWRDSPDW